MARPKKVLDTQQIFKLAKLMCTEDEICDVMGCAKETLRNNYGEQLRAGRNVAKSSLRRAQFKAAIIDRNPTMLVWLGKQHLEQRDMQSHELSGKVATESRIDQQTIDEFLKVIDAAKYERKA